MGSSQRSDLSDMIRSIGRIFSLFYRYGRKTKRTKVFYGISVFPVLLALLIKVTQFFSVGPSSSGMQIFSNMIMTFYLQFLILILTLFFGTSVCSDEVESKTLTYLSTRPIPKPAVILGKYAAYCVLAVIMTAVGVVLSFVFLNLDKLLDFSLYPVLLKDIGVLTLGIICYMSFFTLIGTFMKRSIIFGLVFSFGWENVIQYFPGSTQKFAIVHYLKSLLPPQFSGKGFAVLLFQLEPTPAGTSVAVLIILTGIFLGLACFVFTQKEYILED